MVKIFINSIDVTDYIIEDYKFTISLESEIDLLAYTDNFTLKFFDGLLEDVYSPGGQDFDVYYRGQKISTGKIINVDKDVIMETLTIEFGTTDYLYNNAEFSTFIDAGGDKYEHWPGYSVETKEIVGQKTGSLYEMLDYFVGEIQDNFNYPKIEIVDNTDTDFTEYKNYKISEITDNIDKILEQIGIQHGLNWERDGNFVENNNELIKILENEIKLRLGLEGVAHSIIIPGVYKLEQGSYRNEGTQFYVPAKIECKSLSKEKYIFTIQLENEDNFHYYYKNAKGSNILSDVATVSDKVLIFRGDNLIISDRAGFGSVNVDNEYILEKKQSEEYVIVNDQGIDDLGSGGGARDGIVVLNGEPPFDIKSQIIDYYDNIISGKKQKTKISVLSDGFDTFELVGKEINDLGMIQEVSYGDEIIEIRAEKRLPEKVEIGDLS